MLLNTMEINSMIKLIFPIAFIFIHVPSKYVQLNVGSTRHHP